MRDRYTPHPFYSKHHTYPTWIEPTKKTRFLREFGYIRKTSLLKPDEIEFLKTIDPEYSKAIRILIEKARNDTKKQMKFCEGFQKLFT